MDEETEFFSDGTLGKYSQTPNIAQGGWGWCAVNQQGHIIGGEFGVLEGEIQTVPRAELRALLAILERATQGKKVTVRVDATYLLGIKDDPQTRIRSENGDMWAEC